MKIIIGIIGAFMVLLAIISIIRDARKCKRIDEMIMLEGKKAAKEFQENYNIKLRQRGDNDKIEKI